MHGTQMCDTCDKVVPSAELMLVRVPRPSDPSDLCCIMWGCSDCFPFSDGTCMTDDQWEVFMESDKARRAGYLFLT